MSVNSTLDQTSAPSFSEEIQLKSHQNINLCYQCMKCAGGCPMNNTMDQRNFEILRRIQLNDRETVMSSNAPWLCLSCKTCAARCPNGIDTSKIMDVLKAEAIRKGNISKERNTAIFFDSFLKTVGWFGRLYDFGMIGMYKTRTGTFFADMELGREFMKRGKMPLLPHRIKRVSEIGKIMKRAKEKQR